MKKLLPLILLILIGCSEPEPVNIDLMLELNDGFYTDKNSDKVFNGKAFSEFDSGQKKSIGVIKKGKKDGLWINYHEDGKVKSKIMFEDGIFIDLQPINGEFNEFDGNGNKTKSGFYLDGKKNGIFKTYFSGKNGYNVGWSEFSYKNDILDGPFKRYNTGRGMNCANSFNYVLESGNYKNGKLDGFYFHSHDCPYYDSSYDDGEKLRAIRRIEVNYVDGKKEGVQNTFYRNGRKKAVVNFSNGKKHGLETIYDDHAPNNISDEINYEHGEKHGTRISYGYIPWLYNPSPAYFRLGDHVMLSFTNYSYGEKDGPYKKFSYTKNGERFITEEGTWMAGGIAGDKKVGSNKIYYPSGILKIDSFYVNGFQNGPYKEYDRNGNILIDANKDRGKFIGLYKRYLSGNLNVEKTIDSEGKLIGGYKSYYKNGKLSVEGNYEIGDYQEAIFQPFDYGTMENFGRRRVGVWKFYSESGKIIKEIIYEDGRVIESINY